MSRCVIICSSPVYNIDVIKQEVYFDDYIICADGGFNIACEANLKVDLAVGDFDSIRGKVDKNIEQVVLPVEKDETDTMYAVNEGIRRGFNEFILFCATGGREDHSIANYNVISYLSSLKKKSVIVDSERKIFCLEDGAVEIQGNKNSIVSVFPFNCKSSRVSYKGLAYGLDKELLYCNSTRGISNFMLSELCEIEVYSGLVLIVVERSSKISWRI